MVFPIIENSHCNRIHSSFTAVRCFDNGFVAKQPVAWKEYCEEYWLYDLQESMDRCTGRRDITEILLKTALNTIQSTTLTIYIRYTIPGSPKLVHLHSSVKEIGSFAKGKRTNTLFFNENHTLLPT